MFNANTGREFDRQNQFQDLRQLIRRKGDTLCAGKTRGATARREDLIKILVDAAKVLKAEAVACAPKVEVPKETSK